MTINKVNFDDANLAFSHLERLAENEDYVFRGQGKSSYDLNTTWSRFSSIPHEDWKSDIDHTIDKFRAGLIKIN